MTARRTALLLIRAYQRWISPRKGFVCAHRVHRGGAGCSAVGFRLIRRHGIWDAWPLLRERLRRCAAVAAQRRPLAAQRGDCDLPGIDCDIGACPCDLCSGCDWPRRDKPRRRPPR